MTRPGPESPSAFCDLHVSLGKPYPLVERFLTKHDEAKPLTDHRLLLVQHQQPNHVALVDALICLGAKLKDIDWLGIPYTSCSAVHDYAANVQKLDRKILLACNWSFMVYIYQ